MTICPYRCVVLIQRDDYPLQLLMTPSALLSSPFHAVFSVPPFATTACITAICSDYYEVIDVCILSVYLSISCLTYMHQLSLYTPSQ